MNTFSLCPKWLKCNAPACPLDPAWSERVLCSTDSHCFYMTEAVKDGAESRFSRAGMQELFSRINASISAFSARWPRIKRGLARSQTYGSRMDTVLPAKLNSVDQSPLIPNGVANGK